MDTRSLGYLGLGALIATIIVTLLGVPPALWITAAVVGVVVGVALVVLKAQADGTEVATRFMARSSHAENPAKTPSPVDVELVRAGDTATETPAVWLHRCGGRRVHRFATADGWVVQQVSTKDPDNPRKRVIGEPLLLLTETEASHAADDLAQGLRPNTIGATLYADPALTADARA